MHFGQQIVLPALAYFGLLFGAGFILGVLRVLLVAPRIGARAAELTEMPLMLLIIFFAARFTIRKFQLPATMQLRLAMGGLSLALMLTFEFALILPLRGISFRQYFADRDPIAGTAYWVSLLVFALLPTILRAEPSRE